jgi:xylulokinase
MALQALAAEVDVGLLDGLAISNQRETMAFLDAERQPSYAAFLWLDGRTRAEVEGVTARIGAENIHRINGRIPAVTPSFFCVLKKIIPGLRPHRLLC